MGWGQGIGIGWPNASASAGPPVAMGYFEISSFCNGDLLEGATSQLVDISLYLPGDYVIYTTEIGYIAGLQLGNIVSSPGSVQIAISGPVYAGCPVNFAIDLVCPDYYPEFLATELIAPGLYNTGDYVLSTSFNQTVLLGNIISDLEGYQLIPIEGPSYGACQASYNIHDCILEDNYETGYYDDGEFGNGSRVITQAGNYGYVNYPTQLQEGNTDTEAFAIGNVDNRCNDCNVTFSFEPDSEEGAYFLNLLASEGLGQVNFQSTQNTLLISVNYFMEFTQEDGPGTSEAGTVNFVIPSYNVVAGYADSIGFEFMFNINTEQYNLVSQSFYGTTIEIVDNELGPYDTGWTVPNRYVTYYGNVWTFYYPT